MEQYPQEWRDYDPIQPRGTDWRGFLRRIWAPVAAAGAFLAKFGGFLLKGKFFFSIFASAAVYIWIGGWVVGIGFITLLFIHEMGHVVEARRQGLPVSAPVFIPLMGALITLKEHPRDAWHEATMALAGPVIGSLGAAGFWIAGAAIDSQRLKAVAFIGFLLNLFNLLPIPPLDGGRAVAALHPALWIFGLLGLLGLTFYRPNPIIIFILVIAALELWQRWQSRHSAQAHRYYRVRPWQRLMVGAVYFGLAALLVFAMHETHVPRAF